MSWTEVAPYASAQTKGSAAEVTLTCSAGIKGRRPRMTLTVRTTRLDGIGALLSEGACVRVMCGAAEHATKLRIQPGGKHVVRRTGGKNADGVLSVSFPPLRPSMAGKHAATAIEFDYGDDWLEITLPSWAVDEPAKVHPAWMGVDPGVPTSPPPQPTRPFSMIGGSVPATHQPRKSAR